MERTFWVYIMASRRNGTLYVGITSDLARRVYEHREGLIPGFTAQYGVKRLVWCEAFPTADEAITTEKRVKRWRRAWKLALIERMNPTWDDLYEAWFRPIVDGPLSPDPFDRPDGPGAREDPPGSRLSAALRPG